MHLPGHENEPCGRHRRPLCGTETTREECDFRFPGSPNPQKAAIAVPVCSQQRKKGFELGSRPTLKNPAPSAESYPTETEGNFFMLNGDDGWIDGDRGFRWSPERHDPAANVRQTLHRLGRHTG
jgi:hypothetical protein